jgi:hypothetical protein
MRPFEALLPVANVIGFLAIALPRLRRHRHRRARYLLAAPIIAGTVEILAEGVRWQAVPARTRWHWHCQEPGSSAG